MLMTLPGLHTTAQIGDLLAILCSVLSMFSSFVSIPQYASGTVQGAGRTTGEDFILLPVSFYPSLKAMVFQRRSIILSLPLIFLAYSVAGLISGVIICSF